MNSVSALVPAVLLSGAAFCQVPASYGEPSLEARSVFGDGFNVPDGVSFSSLDVNNNGAIAVRGTLVGDSGEIEDALFVGSVGNGIFFVTRTGDGDTVNPPSTGAAFFETVSLSSDDRVLLAYRFFGGFFPSWYIFDPAVDTVPQFLSIEFASQDVSAISRSRITPQDAIFFSIQGAFVMDGSFIVDVSQFPESDFEYFLTRDLAFVDPGPPPISFDAGMSAGPFNDAGQQAITRFEILDFVNDPPETFEIVERISPPATLGGSPTVDLIASELDLSNGQPEFYSGFSNSPDINANGDVAFAATQRVTGLEDLVVYDGSSLDVLLTEGTPLGGVTITDIGFQFAPRINDVGNVLFFGTDDQGTTGIWITDGVSITSVAALGCVFRVDDFTDTDNDNNFNELTREYTLTSFSPNVDFNSSNTVVFSAQESTGDGRSTAGSAVFSISPGVFSLADLNDDDAIDGTDANLFLAAVAADDLDTADLTNDGEAGAFDVATFLNLVVKGF